MPVAWPGKLPANDAPLEHGLLPDEIERGSRVINGQKGNGRRLHIRLMGGSSMAHLWVKARNLEEQVWALVPLNDDAEGFLLAPEEAAPVRIRRGENADSGLPALFHVKETGMNGWVLITPASTALHVNGVPMATGVCVLRDKDEILCDSLGRRYFSIESRICVEPFPGGERAFMCPRCRLEIEKGCHAVRCPSCNVWLHQTEDAIDTARNLPCWTYAERCAVCNWPTDLNAGPRWTPEGL